MSDWQTYRLEDFVPFTPEVYWRLIERVNETFWPLHILTVVLGVVALILALRGNTRVALALLVPAWLSSGIVFHFNYYAELNWAAPWFGWGFIAQAALLTAVAAFKGRAGGNGPSRRLTIWMGAAIGIGALLAYPLIAAETYGLHPDPTAVATLGILLTALRGASAWLAFTIPFLWCLVASLTLFPLDAAWDWLPATVAVIAAILLVFATISTRASGAEK